MALLAEALQAVFEPTTLLYLLIGVGAGVLIGALPGLTATMAVAILTPLTFWAPPAQGLAMLLGVYNSAIWAGGIPAILINTPGTPASIASTFDGPAIAQRGEAGLALGINTIYSVFGGLFSTLLLAIFAFPIARFALRFGPAEYFALAIFGLSMMVSVSGKSIVKGLIVGVFGLLLSMVGLDPMLSYPRFTFGRFELLDGISFIPVMIGLFGVGEVLDQILKSREEQTRIIPRIGRQLPTRQELARMGPAALFSAAVSAVIGAIPGAGGDIASIICWDQTRRLSKKPQEYGKGSIEGLAATCTANNGVIGGALTTMLTLGLPGDSVTAILLGSLIMYGLQPGPLLFRDHADMAYVIIALMVLAYVAILIVGLGASRVLVRAFMVRKEVVWTAVLILSTVGSYAINNNPLDVWFMFFAGILGLVLRQYGYPLGPLVLALLLGPMAESNFRRALTAAGDAGAWVFVTRPISLILLILAALSLVAPIIQQRRKARQGGVTVQP
ncbi:MAG: tripartite tricarboxylate transporter permease [Limnochorda sp.]|uniref:tripartite tricarboxylate transporter permease n=1 Tax=Limnochorda sp. TaxID=1940279 RepID=UPI0039C49EA1